MMRLLKIRMIPPVGKRVAEFWNNAIGQLEEPGLHWFLLHVEELGGARSSEKKYPTGEGDEVENNALGGPGLQLARS
jgi:hypothetical protein